MTTSSSCGMTRHPVLLLNMHFQSRKKTRDFGERSMLTRLKNSKADRNEYCFSSM